MFKAFLLAAAAGLCGLSAASAQEEQRVTLGWGRLFDNDALGDSRDRWRTGAYTVSRIRGYRWGGALPTMPGEILEFRVRAETIAPADLVSPDPSDRRYAGLLSFGMHTQFDWKGNDVSIGADLVITGPQTRISSFQRWVHNIIDLPEPMVFDDQIGNGVYPTLVGEIGRSFNLGENASVRPFVEGRLGLESLLRVGGDLVIGKLGRDDLMLRDPGTGLRYRGVEGNRDQGFSFVLGGDAAYVFNSALFPAGDPATLSEDRMRLRAGMHWQGAKASMFYGVSYLSPEFDQQSEGQVVGALNLNLRF